MEMTSTKVNNGLTVLNCRDWQREMEKELFLHFWYKTHFDVLEGKGSALNLKEDHGSDSFLQTCGVDFFLKIYFEDKTAPFFLFLRTKHDISTYSFPLGFVKTDFSL